jgi:hypothetical protein
MERNWPAADIAPLIALIDDPRHPINADGTYNGCPTNRPSAILELRLARLTALGRDEIGEELDKLAAEIADYLDILRRARASRDHQGRARRGEGGLRHAAPHGDPGLGPTSTTRT